MSLTSKPELIKDGNKISYKFKLSTDPSVRFQIKLTKDNLSEELENILKKILLNNENKLVFRNFLQRFINETNQYFSKQYTVDIFLKMVQHSIFSTFDIHSDNVKALDEITFYPEALIFVNQGIKLIWSTEYKQAQENILITLPDINESSEELLEVKDLDELPEDSCELEMPYEQLSREVALAKVREARLKAKLAYIQAKISTDNYLKKYGVLHGDLEDSETDDEDEDNSYGDEEDKGRNFSEKVQL